MLGKLSPRSPQPAGSESTKQEGDDEHKAAAPFSLFGETCPETATGTDDLPRLNLSGPYVVIRPRDVYKIGQELGKGNFGSVYKATNTGTNGSYAIKNIPITYRGHRELDLTEDISLVKSLDHPHVIKFFESFRNLSRSSIIMEFCGGGSLKDKLEDVKYFAESDAQILMRQVLRAVGYLHQRCICHRDLKPDNILLQTCDSADLGVLKIADFGFARRFQPQRLLRTQVGTLAYCAPELLKGRYQVPCDLWSCGVTMFLLMSGTLPFQGKTEAILNQVIRRGNYGFWGKPWEDASEDAKALIRGLLRYDDQERFSAKDALRQPFFGQDAGLAVGDLESLARRLYGWGHKNTLQKAALRVIARQMDNSANLSETFAALDEDGDGFLSATELQRAFYKAGLDGALGGLVPRLTDVCPVTYTDFIAMAADASDCLEDSVCREAFRMLDKDGDGILSAADIEGVASESVEQSQESAGTSFEEFAKILENCFLSAGMSSSTDEVDHRASVNSWSL